MPDSTVNNISFKKYFSLLREVVPATFDISACSTDGSMLISDNGDAGHLPDFGSIIDYNRLAELACKRGETYPVPGDKKGHITPVCNTLNEPVVYLVATRNDKESSGTDSTDELVIRSLQAMASCIEKEYSLTAELDAMANELACRYEELNLVYNITDDTSDIDNEGYTLTSLIEKYIEHLDVDMIALAFPKQERIFSATSGNSLIPEAYSIVKTLSKTYLKQTPKDGDFLLINDFTDPQHDKYQLPVPCKILACPVLNSQGNVNGILMCINHLYHPDFYNSDKNLLHVMAKKVAKIMQSNYDVVTGLINQHSFQSVVREAINRSRNRGMFHCVLNIDLDKLKVINESLGREAGDYIIRCVADLLQDKVRNTDTVSYLGEGRYGALLEQCTMEQGMSISEVLRSSINESTFIWKSMPVDTSITIGIALIEPHTDSFDDVLEAAEMARETAKETGFSRIHLYRQNDENLALRKDNLHWVTRIQQALRNDSFIIYCQPISPVGPDNHDYHFEILLRLNDEEGSIIPPGKFIPPAEQFNLMPIIDRWVIDRTFALLSSNGFACSRDEGIVSINLSGQSLADPEITSHIINNADKYRIAPDCVCFEITETTAIRDISSALAIFNLLKSRGFRLSLDDFGTGLSTFSYLKDLPVDFLKIDGSFVRTILEDDITSAMVESINHVGHVMGLATIAEYVENDDLVQRLMHMGVDYLQGYAISEPVELKKYLSGLRSPASACTG